MDILTAVLTSVGVSGATVIGLGAFLGRIWEKRLELREKAFLDLLSDIDISIQKQRIEAYREAWRETGILPLLPKRTANFQEVRDLSKKLCNWYFDGGGIFLSEKTRSGAYEELQKALCEIGDDKQGNLNEAEYEKYRKLCSSLRTAMTNDILSRRELLSKNTT